MKKLFIGISVMLLCTKAFSQKGVQFNPALAAIFDQLNNTSFATLDMEDTSGAVFNTASLAGKTIYVDFWFTTCAPCLKEIPYSRSLQQFFSADTNIVFLNICIEETVRKPVWKKFVKDKELKGIQLFYTRNKPQKVNLLRAYNIMFPTYLLVDKNFKIIGYDAPRPSEEKWVHWAIYAAAENIPLSVAYRKMVQKSVDFEEFSQKNIAKINALRSTGGDR
jgi:thiol-disulfide isomerase/thioredoxin